ncbi:MAG TPA: hypothetical protein P5234_00315 [Thermoanaerobaculaceae bacterium]|nr:hypothetical protein [Thermoanaerobaculaceae bacterium]HRS14672.1 hypothetical protein [Thermoanaerobaculaceae bacterium]
MRKLVLGLVMLAVASSLVALPPAKETFILSAGQGPGSGTSQWRTDAWIFNPSTTQRATVDIYFLPRTTGSGANTNPISRRVEVNALETRELAAILSTTFGLSGTNFGALRFVSDQDVVVTGRIYDANVRVQGQTTAGTAGQFYPGLSSALAIGNGQYTDLVGLAEDAAARSNLAFVEVTGNAANLRIERINASGVVQASLNEAIGGYGARQINRVLQSLQGTSTTNQRVRVTVTGGTGKVLVAASRLDNVTNDPFTIEMTTAAGTGVPGTGTFEGAIFMEGNSTTVDGGLQLVVGTSTITDYRGVAGILCGSVPYTLDFGPTAGTTIQITGNSFTAPGVAIPYEDTPGHTIFTTTWTLAGTRASNGTWSGTLTSVTAGGTGEWASCNGTVNHTWRGGWVSN